MAQTLQASKQMSTNVFKWPAYCMAKQMLTLVYYSVHVFNIKNNRVPIKNKCFPLVKIVSDTG